jgi:hypothetical protein
VLRAVDLLGEALLRLREGREERLMVELAVIKLTRPETATGLDSLLSRIERLERRAKETPPAEPQPTPAVSSLEPAAAGPESPAQPQPAAAATDTGPSPAAAATAAAVVSMERFQEAWPAVFGGLREILGARRWALFREAVPGAVENGRLILHVALDFHLQSLQQDPVVAKLVATKAGDVLGTPVEVEFRSSAAPAASEMANLDEVELEKDRLFEAPEDVADPEKLLATELGATVIEEIEIGD